MTIHLDKNTLEKWEHKHFKNFCKIETKLALIPMDSKCHYGTPLRVEAYRNKWKIESSLVISIYVSTEFMDRFKSYFTSRYSWNGYAQSLTELPHVSLALGVTAIIQERSSWIICIHPVHRINILKIKNSHPNAGINDTFKYLKNAGIVNPITSSFNFSFSKGSIWHLQKSEGFWRSIVHYCKECKSIK